MFRCGRSIVNDAINVFKNVEQELQRGIDKLREHNNDMREVIDMHQAIIDTNTEHIDRATRVLGKVKEITA